MKMSESISEVAKALSAVQGEIGGASKNAQNPHLKNRYADISAVWDAIRPVLPKHGLAVSQVLCDDVADGMVCVETVLMHTSGQWISGRCSLPAPKRDPQGYGSAITYARRYSLSAMIGVVSEDDDDAEGAMPKAAKQQQSRQRQQAKDANTNPMTDAQNKALMAYLTKRHGQDRAAYIAELSDFFGRNIASSRELTKDDVSEFLDAINNGVAHAE